jgi:hypothetical protein
MVKILRSRRRRWRGVPLGGPLQRGCKFCLAANDGEAKTRPANAGQRDGPRLATTRSCRARRDQLTNAMACRLVRRPPMHRE